MAIEKYDESYEVFYGDKNDFMSELKDRCKETVLYKVKPDSVEFYSAQADGDKMVFKRLVGEKTVSREIQIEPCNESVWKSPETQSVGLFISFITDDDGKQHYLPISPHCKLSLSNRSKLTFTGELTIPVNKLALARMYEDLIKKEIKKEQLQIISVYGKAHAVLSNVYSPIGHDEFFELIDDKLTERFSQSIDFRRGYVSHKWSRGIWYVGEFTDPSGKTNQIIQLGLSAMDGQTGHCGAALQPCVFYGRKGVPMLFDDEWYSKHMALSEEGISEALDVVYLKLQDNAQKLIDTIGIDINNPANFAQKLCIELNKLAKKTSTVPLSAKAIKDIVTSVEGLSIVRNNLTVWDVIEVLWDSPEKFGASTAHKDSLTKTVSRVLAIDNYKALDVA